MRGWLVIAGVLLVATPGRVRAEGETPPSGSPEANRVVARVNQTEITYGEFKSRLENVEQERGPVPPDRQGEILRGMVQEEILYEGAVADGLDKDAAVTARVEQARRHVLIEELLKRKILQRTQVTEEEAQKTYEENKPLFSSETVTARHILVKTQDEAETILKELEGGKDFAEIARAKSQDAGSAERGGDLGPLRRGQTVPEFEEEAFRLKDGELSGVIKTQYGYHVLKGGAHVNVTQPFEEVKERIQQSLLQQKQREAFMAFMTDLEKQAKTEVFEDRLR